MIDVDTVELLFYDIDKVTIIKGIIKGDPVVWEFHIKGKKLTISKLDTPEMFREEYLKTFNVPAPEINIYKWNVLLRELGAKSEVVDTLEESEPVFIARQIFEQICNYPTLIYPCKVGYCLYYQDGFLYMTIKQVKDLVDKSGFEIPLTLLSKILTELGVKTEGTKILTYIDEKQGERAVRSWEFRPDKVLQ